MHKEFGGELNVVIIEKIDLKKQKVGHALLFSSDFVFRLGKVDRLLQLEISDRV